MALSGALCDERDGSGPAAFGDLRRVALSGALCDERDEAHPAGGAGNRGSGSAVGRVER